MWEGASTQKIEATRAYGAAVDLEADGPGPAFDRLHDLMEETGRPLVHPFDDPLTIAGQGTVGLEIVEDVPETTVVIVPVGGGRARLGRRVGAEGRRIVAVEPELSDACSKGLEAASPSRRTRGSIADGSAPLSPASSDSDLPRRDVETVLVTEDEIDDGMRFLYGRAKLACEPAAASEWPALLAGKIAVEPQDTVAVVVSGGNVAPEMASAILAFK
jgi:threonine dehydratase